MSFIFFFFFVISLFVVAFGFVLSYYNVLFFVVLLKLFICVDNSDMQNIFDWIETSNQILVMISMSQN